MIIRLKGGMGNQMFQYAMGKMLSTKWEKKVYFDDSSFESDELRCFELDELNVSLEKASQKEIEKYKRIRYFYNIIYNYIKIKRLFGIQLEKREFCFDKYKYARYFDGYWQNVQYFQLIREQLQQEFVFTGELTKYQEQIIDQMKQESSVALHVRHGDYLANNNQDIFVCLPINYYQQAIDLLREKIGSLRIYVFSDDIAWCKQNFTFCDNLVFVDESISNRAKVDFELMRNCKHFIIANSTFSWWPAWLASNKDKIVIAPQAWFCDERDNQAVRQGLNRDWICL